VTHSDASSHDFAANPLEARRFDPPGDVSLSRCTMNRWFKRILAVAGLAGLFWTVPLLAQAPPGTATYRVTIVLYPGDDAAAVARRLAAMYRGTLETPVDGNGSFTISLSEAGAGLMRRDPMVAEMDAPSLAPRVPPRAASVAPAVAAAPGMVRTNGTSSWSFGPYRYDGSGNIRAVGSEFYIYDKLGRVVVSADAPPSMPVVHKQTYTYDPYGNLSSMNTAGRGLTTLATSGVSNRLATVSNGAVSAPVGYDAAGNFISYQGATYEYDALNVMRKAVAGGVTRSYVYNANDERIGTVEESGSGVRSEWTIRDSEGRVLRRFSRESNGEWKWQEDYIYRGSQLLAAEVPDSAKARHFHLDHLGTPRLITGNGGVELSRHTYHPFGEEIAPSAGAREKKQFTGHERDSESLDYMHARFYAPFMGRFLSVDPGRDWDLRRPQSWNMYAYVQNNPINRTDPTGKYTCSGSKDDCKQIVDALTEARTSVANLPKNSAERARVNAIVNLYGKPGQRNGVVVDTSGKGRIPNAAGGASMEGKTLTFSVSIAVVKDQVSAFPNANLKSELAGVLMHDGQHLFDFRKTGRMFGNKAEELAGERRAGFTEAFMWQGLGQNASSEIYTNATGVNPAAIEFYAQRATAMWCDNGGPCQ
jgi:RHS repeat-associated protein